MNWVFKYHRIFAILYFYRSSPDLGLAIFTYLILWFSRRRTFKLEEQRKSDLEEFDRQIEIATQNQVDILTKQNKLEEEYKSVCEQFKQYESFVKFAFEMLLTLLSSFLSSFTTPSSTNLSLYL